MNQTQISSLFNQFQIKADFKSFSEITSGHINDTYLIETNSSNRYVLQRINHEVFKDVPGLINNKVLVSKHLVEKVGDSLTREVLQFVPSNTGLYYHLDEGGNYWNLSVYIEDSKTFDIVPNEKVAYEGGKLTGEFLNLTSDMDSSKLIDVIPKFHDMTFRFKQFDQALGSAMDERIGAAQNEIQYCKRVREEMLTLQRLKESGDIPVRVTHNDTKISNILFNSNDEGLAMIDTDTVMPGILHYDFGDAIRTICNSAVEDEKDLSKVKFNMAFYESYKRGLLEGLGTGLTELEKEHLTTSVKSMIFIMGLRFLTDYLNNDVYYKTSRENHNLDRARNQFKLLQSFEEQLEN